MPRTVSDLGNLCARLIKGEERLANVVKVLAAESNQRIDEMINSLAPATAPSDPLEKFSAKLELILEKPEENRRQIAEHVAAAKAAREATAESVRAKADLDARRVKIEHEEKEKRRLSHEQIAKERDDHSRRIAEREVELAARAALDQREAKLAESEAKWQRKQKAWDAA